MVGRAQERQEQSHSVRRQAVVIGGSIGGMVAARVLSEHFEEVLLIERDMLPAGQENRPGVPHARHLHFILKRGLMIIDQLFPRRTKLRGLQSEGAGPPQIAIGHCL